MKWSEPVAGQMRTKTKFLLLPTTLQDSGREHIVTRWLEMVEIRQCYTVIGRAPSGSMIACWEDLHWVDI